MARTFTITCAAGTIRIAGQARGECSFTVTNSSAVVVKAQPSAVALDGRANAWFAVAGEPVRELAPGQTVQVTVVINPSGAPPGRYGFRLDVLSADGGERCTGPEACVELTSEAAPLPPGSTPFPWWILILIAALLLVIGVVLWLVLREGDGATTTTPEPANETPIVAEAGTTPPATPTTAPPTADRRSSTEAEALAERWAAAFRKQDIKALTALTTTPALIDGRRADDATAIPALYKTLLGHARTLRPPTTTKQRLMVGRVRQLDAKLPREAKSIGLDAEDHAIGISFPESDLKLVLLIRHGPPARVAAVVR